MREPVPAGVKAGVFQPVGGGEVDHAADPPDELRAWALDVAAPWFGDATVVAARVRLTKSPQQYAATRDTRHELPYEAVLEAGRSEWTVGERVRVYRATRGRSRLIVLAGDDDDTADHASSDPAMSPAADPHDYDVEHYLRVLRDTYAARLSRALTPEDFAAVFADPEQPSLFARSLAGARPILTTIVEATLDPDDDPEPSTRALHG
jgi:hypothetical protein